ncbi:unnamed protein product [Callosobruchus maculatus]|uniref:peptidylprolyl isomerase n=1 Tax=Callosobruchus maculatus TaxID=64391 RepID=A0A653DM14_CALMS|nr:unnamed protein product [Callosobruchus maculatus]
MSNAFIEHEKIAETKNATEHAKDTAMSNGALQSLSGGDINVEHVKLNGTSPSDPTNTQSGDEIKEIPQSKEELATSHKTDTITNKTDEVIQESIENVAEENSSEKTDESDKETPRDEWTDLLGSGVIMKKVIIEGKPDSRPERSEKCIVNYTCYLEDETVIESCGNFEVYLGEYDVIQGLDVSLGLMNVGEKCRLKIQPRLAYGSIGLPPKIPSNTTLIYDIELVAVEPEPNADTLSIQERKILGNKKKERGNWWYQRGENNVAVQCYRRALDYLNEVETSTEKGDGGGATDAELQVLLENRVSVCNNMAAAQIKMEAYDQALTSLQTVLTCQPDNVKAHFRKAKVYIGKNDLPVAMRCLMKAKELAPNDADIQKEINHVSRMLERQKQSERELARRMFNGPQQQQQKEAKNTRGVASKKKSKQGSKVGVWATLGAVVAVGVAGLVAYRFKYV